jgi:hypothetical protein
MTGHEHDEALEQLLHRTLTDEADGVMPAGDGLSRIRTKIAARQRRLLWLRPAVALGSAAAVAAVAFGAYALVGSGNSNHREIGPSTQTPTSEPTPTNSVSPTPAVTATTFPPLAIYPFPDKQAADSWDHDYLQQIGPAAPYNDPKQVATMWVQSLGITDVDQVTGTTTSADDTTATVTLGRTMTAEQGGTVDVTDVHLVHYLDAWLVVGASDAQSLLRIDSPAAGDGVSSPLTVTGPTWGGVEESVNFDLRSLDDAGNSGSVATGNAFFGNGPATWSTTLRYRLSHDSWGELVATELSQADGGTQRLVAERVDISGNTAAAPLTYFYAPKDGRIAEFAAADASFVRYVTPIEPGGGASDPKTAEGSQLLYYLQGGGTCANTLMEQDLLAASGATPPPPRTVATPDAGYVITGFSAPSGSPSSPDAPMAYVESACDQGAAVQQKLVMTDVDGHQHVIKFQGNPPAIVGDPAVDLNGDGVFAVLHTGTANSVVRYSMSAGNGPNDYAQPCPAMQNSGFDPQALAWEPVGKGLVWVVGQSGSHSSVGYCDLQHGYSPDQFSIDAAPSDISVSSQVYATVLVATTDGQLWRYDGGGPATKLSPSIPITEVTW